MASRFDDVRLRARRAKTTIAACAVALFAVVGVVARTTHPGASTSSKAPATSTDLPSDTLTLDDGESESEDNDGFSGFSGATISPSPSLTAPSASTGTS